MGVRVYIKRIRSHSPRSHTLPRASDVTLALRLPSTVWWAIVFVTVALAALLVALPAPQVTLRRRIARRAARSYFHLTGTRLRITGLERLPAGPCVVVAN